MAPESQSSHEEKARIRERVSELLLRPSATDGGPVALPDAVFDLELEHFITDFKGSIDATRRLVELDEWRSAHRVFITPDNSTERLREMAIRQGKETIMTTYGIRRGSVLLTRAMVPEGQEEHAATLVGMERFGRSLATIQELEAAGKVDLMVTGALAISRAHGGRAGKGAGWFDAEWGIWGSLGLVVPETPVIGIVHDAQVVAEAFPLDAWDCHVTIIVTPTQVIRLPANAQPRGVLWDQIVSEGQARWLAAIPYMRELYRRRFGVAFPGPPGGGT